MTTLDRAVPLTEMDHVAVTVGQDLHFDVPGTINEFFHVQPWIPKRCIGFSLSRFVQLHQLIRTGDEPHSTAAAASGGLDHDGIAHGSSELSSCLGVG